MEEIVQSVYQDAKVEEWWEWDGGEPYWFRILLTAKDPAPPLTLNEVLALVDEYKSFRSHLEGVYYHIPHDIVIQTKFGYACYWGRVCGTYPYRRRYGSIEDTDLVVETKKGGLLYRNPFTDELVAGTFPERATSGSIDGDGIIAQTDGRSVSYTPRYCGSTPGSLI